MTPGDTADLKGALVSAVNMIKDANHPEAQVRARLEFLLWRVIEGRCSDFFKRTESADGRDVYEDRPVRTITKKVLNPLTGQVEEYSRDVYSMSPQWANPRRVTDGSGNVFTYVHCRYKQIKYTQ